MERAHPLQAPIHNSLTQDPPSSYPHKNNFLSAEFSSDKTGVPELVTGSVVRLSNSKLRFVIIAKKQGRNIMNCQLLVFESLSILL